MTAVAEAPAAAPAEVVSEAEAAPESAPAPAADSEPRLTRRSALAALEKAFTEFADQVILARRLTLGTSNVVSQALCTSGTKEFMVRGHLQPLKRSAHPSAETPEEAEEAEGRIRDWVRTKMPGALEDYTATGLMRQVAVVQEAQKKWHKEFRDSIITNFKAGYILPDRMAEVMPLLGMEPYVPHVYTHVSLNVDWHAPATSFGEQGLTLNAMAERLRERIRTALVDIAGDQADTAQCSYGFGGTNGRYFTVRMDNWQH